MVTSIRMVCGFMTRLLEKAFDILLIISSLILLAMEGLVVLILIGCGIALFAAAFYGLWQLGWVWSLVAAGVFLILVGVGLLVDDDVF